CALRCCSFCLSRRDRAHHGFIPTTRSRRKTPRGGASRDTPPRDMVRPPARPRFSNQLFLARKVSWQPPQFFCTVGNTSLKLASSFTLAAAALASSPNFLNLASKSAFFSHTAGSAAVSPPVFELSGNRVGILLAASS